MNFYIFKKMMTIKIKVISYFCLLNYYGQTNRSYHPHCSQLWEGSIHQSRERGAEGRSRSQECYPYPLWTHIWWDAGWDHFLVHFFLLSKLINEAMNSKVPPIAPEAINLHPSNTYHKIENLNLAIESARSIGCMVVNIRPEFIMEKREHIVLGLIWQIIRVSNHKNIDSHRE